MPNAEQRTPQAEMARLPGAPAIAQPSAFGRIFWRIVAIGIGGLFVYAGAVKVIDPVEFARDIDNYKMLPWQIGIGLALYLPWLEIFAGLALVTGVLYRGGVLLLTGLMAVFVVATIIARARGLDISCGCFGHASKYLSFAWHLVLDFLLLAGLALLWKRSLARADVRAS
jgi:putative oxidoreductase